MHERNSTLTTLDLWANGIGDEGARALHTVLQQNIALARLVLLDNGLSAECERLLAGASDVIEFKGRRPDAERGVPPRRVGRVSTPRGRPSASSGSSIASTTKEGSRQLPSEVQDSAAHV